MKFKPTLALISSVVMAAFLLTLPAVPVYSQDINPYALCEEGSDADFDGDGIRNMEECAGLVANQDGAYLTVPGYLVNPKNGMNPAVPDLFVILVKANDRQVGVPTLLPEDPFRYVQKSVSDGGLGLNVHVIPFQDGGQALLNYERTEPLYRTIISRSDGTFQKAMKIEESLSTSSYELAKCLGQWSTPNGGDDCWVYSQKIINHIEEICSGYNPVTCIDDLTKESLTDDSPQNGIPDIAEVFMRDSIAHEIGHDVKLRDVYDAKTGGWHYSARDKVMMSQYVDYRAGSKGVTFYIANKYADPPDAAKATIWEEQ